jgi:hypothetical protein
MLDVTAVKPVKNEAIEIVGVSAASGGVYLRGAGRFRMIACYDGEGGTGRGRKGWSSFLLEGPRGIR